MVDLYALCQRADVARYLYDNSPSKGLVAAAFLVAVVIGICIALYTLDLRGLL